MKTQELKTNQGLQQVFESIDVSLEQAQQSQQKKLSSEEIKNQYYQQELQRMRQQISQLQNSNSSSYTPQQTISPLLVDKILTSQFSAEHQDQHAEPINYQKTYENLSQSSDDYKKELDAPNALVEFSESKDDYIIQPIYNRTEQSRNPLDPIKRTQKPIHSKSKTIKPDKTSKNLLIEVKKNLAKSLEGKNNHVIKPSQRLIQKGRQVLPVKIKSQQTKQKENLGENGYLEHILNSDIAYQHLLKRTELQCVVQETKDKARLDLLMNKNSQPYDYRSVQNKDMVQAKQPKLRGIKDIMDNNLFGRPLPCHECSHYLSQGLSSDYCKFHGKHVKEVQPAQQVPKRFEKFL